jgi:hypothetical protein
MPDAVLREDEGPAVTDLVKFGVPTIEEAMRLGKEAADYVTQYFV